MEVNDSESIWERNTKQEEKGLVQKENKRLIISNVLAIWIGSNLLLKLLCTDFEKSYNNTIELRYFQEIKTYTF